MRIIWFLILSGLLAQGVLAQDVEGSQDHPVISRYPGSVIQWYMVDNYRPFRLPLGPVTGYRHIDKWIDTEGRVTRIYYALEGGKRTYSEVYKNYLDALKSAGMELLAEGMYDAGMRGGGVGSRAWLEVYYSENPFNSDGAVNNMARGTSTSGGAARSSPKRNAPPERSMWRWWSTNSATTTSAL